MNDVTFQTGGDWASTTLHNNGVEVAAVQLVVMLKAGRDEWDNPVPGGLEAGATEFSAYVRTQDAPDDSRPLLPGRVTLRFPGNEVIVENVHPLVEVEATRVTFNGEDITRRVVDVFVDVNVEEDSVRAFVSVYKSRFLRGGETVTTVLVG